MRIASEMARIGNALDAVEDGKAAIAEAITAKGVDTLPDSSFDTLAGNIGLIEGGGSGIPLQLELVGEWHGYLPEYTSTTVESIDTGIDLIGIKYLAYIYIVKCDGICESKDDWGGKSIGVYFKNTSNKVINIAGHIDFKGNGSTEISASNVTPVASSNYGIKPASNRTNLVLQRTANASALKKIMGGNYSLEFYAITSF